MYILCQNDQNENNKMGESRKDYLFREEYNYRDRINKIRLQVVLILAGGLPSSLRSPGRTLRII